MAEETILLKVDKSSRSEVLRLHVENAGLIVQAMSLDDSAQSGWALTSDGRAFRLSGGRWLLDTELDSLAPFGARFLQTSRDGRTAWALDGGQAFRFTSSRWEARESDSVRIWTTRSAWISPDGEQGWAWSAGPDKVFRLANGHWTIQNAPTALQFGQIAITEDGSAGWARATYNALFRYTAGRWYHNGNNLQLDRLKVTSDGVFFGVDKWAGLWRVSGDTWELLSYLREAGPQDMDVWLAAGGQSGWVVGDSGVFRWEEGRPLTRATPADARHPRGIWMNRDGSLGYVFGEDGILFRFAAGVWHRDNPLESFAGTLGNKTFTSVALSRTGEHGWAIGEDGLAARYSAGTWRRDSLPSVFRQEKHWELALNESATSGWAVGDSGVVMRLENDQWVPEHSVQLGIGNVSCPFYNAGTRTLIGASRWGVMQYAATKWTLLQLPSSRSNAEVQCVWPDGASNRLLVWFDDGTLNRFQVDGSRLWETDVSAAKYETIIEDENGHPTWANPLDKKFSPLVRIGGTPADTLSFYYGFGPRDRNAWIDSRGKTVIAVGRDTVFHFLNDRWVSDALPRSMRNPFMLYEGKRMWVDPSGREAWIVGALGTIVRMESQAIPDVHLHIPSSTSLERFSGEFMLYRAGMDSLLLHGIEIVGCSDPPLPLPAGASYTTTHTAPGALRIALTSATRNHLLQRYSRSRCTLRFDVALAGLTTGRPVPVSLVHTFYIRGRPAWHLAIAGVGVLLLINVLLVLIATRSRWLRGVILSPVGSSMLGLIVGKYLIIEPLVRHVRPIRLAMFRDYRQRARFSPAIERWRGREYIPPTISIGEDAPDVPSDEDSWAAVFGRICTVPRGRVWLVEGSSGLGKTALLERWLELALEAGRTPLLIRLGQGSTALEEAAMALAQYGDVRLQEEAVETLLVAGGFVLLLDGLNEDRRPEVTRTFVRRTSSRNTVIVTSQFDPGWDGDVYVESVRLARFGRDQLLHLLSAEWVDAILDSGHLREAVGLPQTAQLVASFIHETARLPAASVEVYKNVRQQLGSNFELLNLEAAAWGLFRENGVLLPEGQPFSEPFLAQAVKAGILSVIAVNGLRRHRFVHERVHSYFVMCYLVSQHERPLKDWHAELRTGLPHTYWRVVLEFWGETHALAVQEGRSPTTEYESFLRATAEFDAGLFRAVYRQADRFSAAGFLTLDPQFIKEAARIMAGTKEQ